ncbi:MAG: glycosyltransferase [Rhodanobacteraceae bacterium]|nr:glycosyltransferase [Rhodanobacteraceae bacterium]
MFSDGREFIVTVGRLCAAKNYESLLRVFFRVHELRPQAKLVIAGDGELKRYLFELSTQLGLRTVDVSSSQAEAATEADVVFLGHQSNPFKFVRHANLFVFPSLWEGFPLALCEAMACGVPVVSADCPQSLLRFLVNRRRNQGSAVLEPTWTNAAY